MSHKCRKPVLSGHSVGRTLTELVNMSSVVKIDKEWTAKRITEWREIAVRRIDWWTESKMGVRCRRRSGKNEDSEME